MIVIGYILGIPITTMLIYFCVVRPLFRSASKASPKSAVGKAYTGFGWLVLAAFGFGFLVILSIIIIVVSAP